MLNKWFLTSAFILTAMPNIAHASCDVTHILQEGDSLLSVAEQYYGDRSRWSVIYYANDTALAGNLVNVPVGVELNIPCLEATNKKADPKPLLQDDAGIRLLTGSNYAPFADQEWSGQGLATELVNAALEESPSPVPFSLTWENDWSQHLFPKLDNKEFDMGFPWIKPDCAADLEHERCVNFHFSEPIFNILVRLYVDANSSIAFENDDELLGKTLCRPKGYFTHDLDGEDRQWLSKNLVTLIQADTPEGCFDLLTEGKVDGVTVNEFLGYQKIKDMGLAGEVKTLDRPVSTETLHVIISKRHWRGTTHLYRFNAGLEKLKATKRYEEIVSRHLGLFWGE